LAAKLLSRDEARRIASNIFLWSNRTLASGGPTGPTMACGTHIVWGDEAKPPVFDISWRLFEQHAALNLRAALLNIVR
jgi:hypothetical protein